MPAGDYHVRLLTDQFGGAGGAIRIELLLRSGSGDQMLASLDGTITAMADLFIPYYVTHFNGQVDTTLTIPALAAVCGDQLVARLTVMPGTADVASALWLDVP